MPTYDAATTNKCSSLTQLGGSFQYVPICSHDIPYMCSAEVPEYLAPAQEQGAIMIGVTGYPGPSCCLSNVHWTFRFQKPLASFGHNMPQPSSICSGGVGKSSWVNAVRRVSSPNDPDFAELCVDGPTMEPQMYRFPAQTLGCDGPHPSTVSILNVTKWWKWMKMIYRIIYILYISYIQMYPISIDCPLWALLPLNLFSLTASGAWALGSCNTHHPCCLCFANFSELAMLTHVFQTFTWTGHSQIFPQSSVADARV